MKPNVNITASLRPTAVRPRLDVLSLAIVLIIALSARDIAAQPTPGHPSRGAPSGSRKKVLTLSDPIPNQYIVVLKDALPTGHPPTAHPLVVSPADAELTKRHVYQLASKHHVVPVLIYTTVLRGFMTRCSAQRAEELANDPEVKYVEQDGVVKALQECGPSCVPWGLDRIDQVDLPLDSKYQNGGLTGSGVNVYILDTGIQTSNPDFEERASSVFGTTGDCNGHGTQVAGIVGGKTYGVAKGVHLFSVQVLDCNGRTGGGNLIAAVEWVTINHPKSATVANMSLGRAADVSLNQAVENSILSGISYVAAAGNGGENACDNSPAGVAEAITVGATFIDSDQFDERCSFSAIGACVTLFAPGDGVDTDWNSPDAPFSTFGGTSASAPHVTGIVALYLQQHPQATPGEIKSAIVANSLQDKVRFPGDGSPNKLAYMGFLLPSPSHPLK